MYRLTFRKLPLGLPCRTGKQTKLQTKRHPTLNKMEMPVMFSLKREKIC